MIFTTHSTTLTIISCWRNYTIIKLLQALYNNAEELQVKINNEQSDMVSITERVLQEELLSALLFTIFINDIGDYFREARFQEISIECRKDIMSLAYADDLTLFCNSPIDVIKELRNLQNYCNQNSLNVNTDKTKILMFHSGCRATFDNPLTYNNYSIEIVTSFNYLGIMFTSLGLFKAASEHNVKKGVMAIHKVKNILQKGKFEGWPEKIQL